MADARDKFVCKTKSTSFLAFLTTYDNSTIKIGRVAKSQRTSTYVYPQAPGALPLSPVYNFTAFSFPHSLSLRFRQVNFLTQVSFLHLYRNYTWPWPIFMISRIQLHVFHLKWKKCNYIHCSFRTKLRLRTNFRIVLSTYLHNLLGRFQASCSPEAVVPKDFAAPRVYHRCAQ